MKQPKTGSYNVQRLIELRDDLTCDDLSRSDIFKYPFFCFFSIVFSVMYTYVSLIYHH